MKHLFLILVLTGMCPAASRYWVGGGSSANWNAVGPTNWSSSSGGPNDASVPGSLDDVFFDVRSGSGISHISASIAIQSLDMLGSTASVVHDAGATLTIAGSGGVFRLAGGKYSLGNVTSSALTFTGTSGFLYLTTAGNNLGNITFNGPGGTWVLTDAVNTHYLAAVTLSSGSLQTDGQANNSGLTHSWGTFTSTSGNNRTLNLGASSITITGRFENAAWNVTATNLSLLAGSSTITVVGVGSGFYGGAATYNNVVSTTEWSAIFGASSTFKNLTVNGVVGIAVTDYQVSFLGPFTVTGTLTIAGNSAVRRIFVNNNVLGTDSPSSSPATITLSGPSVNVAISNADFQDIAFASANGGPAMPLDLSAIPGLSGDCGGNANIIFTPSTTQTWSGSSSGNWSTNAWTSRVPLPQDDVVIPSATMTITADMTRLGRNITWTGSTGTPTWAFTVIPANYIGMDIYGSLTLIPNLKITGTQVVAFNNRNSSNLTSAGVTWPNRIIFQMMGGTMNLVDAFSTTNTVTLYDGTLNVGPGGLSAANFDAGPYPNVRTINMGSGPWSLTGSGTVWNLSNTVGLTVNKGSGIINITDTSSSLKTFTGGGKSYNNISITPGGGGAVSFNGANSFAAFTATGPKTIVLPGGLTTTVASLAVSGSAGNLLSMLSSSGTATIAQASGTVSGDYLSLTNIAAAGAVPFYAGTHSTNNGGNTNWSFTAPASAPESIGTPSTPAGVTSGVTGASYTFTAAGAASSTGDPIQYQFDFGNGQVSGWLPVNQTQASNSWPVAGNYPVRVTARCSIHTAVVSTISAALNVVISGTPALGITMSHSGVFVQGQSGTYTLAVTNNGTGPTSGTVTVIPSLPAGLALGSLTGSGWTCASGSCTRSDALAAGSSYSGLTLVVNVAATAGFQVPSQATASGGTSISATATDITLIRANGPPAAPAIKSLTPFAGSGLSQTFTVIYSSPNGWSNLSLVYLQVNIVQSPSNACYVEYNVAANTMRLIGDDAITWQGPITPGAGTLKNAACTLNGADSSASGSGAELAVNYAVTFASNYIGRRNIFLQAKDSQGVTLEWSPYGAWWPTISSGTLTDWYVGSPGTELEFAL